MGMNGSRLMLLVAAVMTLTALGCAQQVGDIDRTQANALRKADFQNGEWYIRQTFTEVPPAAFAGFVGLTGDLEKIRWEITEDYLIAYRSYEHNPGAYRNQVYRDENGNVVYAPGREEGYGGDALQESAIAAYRIVSHFDVQRQYNASTGEQSNVIVENASDRLWWERDWFRVDWSNRLTTGIMFDNYLLAGVSMYVQPSEPSSDALVMDYFDRDANIPGITPTDYVHGDLYYMDFTNRVLLDPYYTYCFGLWYPQALDDCGASEVEMRTSLLRVPAVSDYEPIFYDDIDQQKFGYFRTERLVYDARRGTTLTGQILLGNRHSIWSNTWVRNPDGSIATDANGRAIPRPFAERTPRPVVYHMSPHYPEDLIDDTRVIESEWDRAFRRAVAAAQGKSPQEVGQMFFICHNPVRQEDPLQCGDLGLNPQLGDLRYNFVAWVDQPQMSGPLGYGPSNADPETGEIIAAQAFVYGAAVDTYTTYALDLIRFLNGDLELRDLDDATFIRNELLARANPYVDPRGMIDLGGREFPTDLLLEDLNLREMLPDSALRFMDRVEVTGWNDFVHRPGRNQQVFNRIAETGLGALAVDDEVVRGFGVSDLNQLPTEMVGRYFQNGSLMPRLLTERRERTMRAAAESMCFLDHNDALDDTVVGMAMQYRGRTDYDNIWHEIRGLIYRAVQEHEIGHTVGLRHNFQGSYDSINYHDRYWELKTAGILGVVNANTGEFGVVPFRSPLYLSDLYGMAQMTPAQIEGRMREYQYSSIMDYSSSFNTDIHGIGKYDEAAIIYAYTTGRDRTVDPSRTDQGHPLWNTQERGYVEVFNEVGDALPIFRMFEGLESPAYPDLLEYYHYSTVATEMASQGGVYNQAQAPALIQSRMRDRSLYRYGDLVNEREADNASRPVEVPYLFLEDYWVGASQSNRVWDQGADPLEQALNLIERYRTYYPFEYFRRDRAMWFSSDIASRLYSRYFIDMIDNYQRWLFEVGIQSGRPDSVLDNGWTFGAFASLNLLAEVMATPSYGSFRHDANADEYVLQSYNRRADAALYVAPGEGRRPYSRWDPTRGFNYWAYPVESGHFWAFYAAIIAMSASSSLAVRGADVGADFLSYSIPPYLVFEDEITTLYNSIFLEDHRAIAPRVIQDQTTGRLQLERRIFSPIGLQGGGFLDPETGFVATNATLMDSSLNTEVGATIALSNSFTYQFYAMLYGMAFFDSNFSLHFHDQAKIFRIASGETVTPPDGFEVVSFCDPFSRGGVCYGAIMEEGTNDPPAGARLILRTQDLYQQFLNGTAREWEVINSVELMNLIRGMYEIFGNSLT
jgi:hypothetical protein